MGTSICSACVRKRLLRRNGLLEPLAATLLHHSTSSSSPPPPPSKRLFSVLNRPPPNYPGHVPLTTPERIALAIGSALGAFRDPHRHDLIAALGEATAQPYFITRLRDAMLLDATGRRILRERPRISSATLDLPQLRQLPAGSVGRAYADWLDREGVTPDTRAAVRYLDGEEEAYVMQRYRESHDFYHAVTGLPVVREGEVALKAFEFANTRLPMTGLSVASVATLRPRERERFWRVYGPWAWENGVRSKDVICVYWEERLRDSVEDLRAELGIQQPPDLRDIRKREREERRKRKEREKAAKEAVV